MRLAATRVAACMAVAYSAMCSSLAAAPIWVNPATGDWFDANNWDTATVPGVGTSPVVSNGGTATLSAASAGVTETPLLGSLNIGLGGSGTGIGTVSSTGVAIRSSGAIGVGTVSSAGTTATGALTVTGAGGTANSASVGLASGATGAATATGTLQTDGSLLLTGGPMVVGEMFDSARGSSASGTVSIGGDAGTVGIELLVGNVFTSSTARAGSTAQGQLTVGGGLNVGGGAGVIIGNTTFIDRDIVTGSIDQAAGVVQIGGTLGFTGDHSLVDIGTTNDGMAHGSLTASTLAMGANRIDNLSVGTSSTGQATGSFIAGGGDLRFGTLVLGATNTGSANGHLDLTGTTVNGDSVQAGTGPGGTAHIALHSSTAAISNNVTLNNGQLSLDRSAITIGNTLTLGSAATLQIDIDGLLRGTEYGAIDTGVADLDGTLAVDFSSFVPSANEIVFDLIRSGATDGIFGDFTSFAFTGLASGYSVAAGAVLDGVEIYRLTLERQSVPEPGTLALLLSGLVVVVSVRAHRRARCRRRRCWVKIARG